MRGSVFKYRTKKGQVQYGFVFDIGWDPQGKRRQKRVRGFQTRKEAEKALAQAIAEVERGTYLDPGKMTLGEYLREWLRLREGRVSESTHYVYGVFIRNWLIPLLGAVPLAKLNAFHIERAYEAMKGVPLKRAKSRTANAATVRYAHLVLHKALRDAVKKRLIPYNPTDAVEPPRGERRQTGAFDEASTAAVLAATRGTYLFAPVALAVYTGMRPGEVLGLKWEDVDLKNGTISVRRALKRSRERGLVLGEPKTAKSRRCIEIGPDCVAALKRQKKLQAEWRLKAGPVWQEWGLVCTREDGSPIHPNTFTGAFRRLAAQLGLKATPRTLRHTHATLLLKAGVPLKVVQERLGHATIAMTGDIYSHVLPGMQGDAARAVEEVLRGCDSTVTTGDMPGPQSRMK